MKESTNKLKHRNKWQIKLIVCLSLLFILLCTLIFYDKMEYLLHIRPNLSMIDKGCFEVHFVDVGQGDCILARFSSGETMIIDSGPADSKERLVSYIDNVFFYDKPKVFDYALLTHSDADHSGNMAYIIKNYEVNNFYRPRAYAYGVEEENDNAVKVATDTYADVILALNNAEIKNLHYTDEEDLYAVGKNKQRLFTIYPHSVDAESSTNEYSPIVILEGNGRRVCVTGDAIKVNEQETINKYDLPDVDVLKLGHHGSATSTSMELLKEITPEYVVVSVGENSYGHPSEKTLQTLYEYDQISGSSTYASLLTTRAEGNIIYYFSLFDEVGVTTILNIYDYIFVPYYIIVIAVSFVLITIAFIPLIRKNS